MDDTEEAMGTRNLYIYFKHAFIEQSEVKRLIIDFERDQEE